MKACSPAQMLAALLTAGLLITASCGGGGGGGGGDGGIPGGSSGGTGGTGGPTGAAGFVGFSFRTGPSSAPIVTTTPPLEDLAAAPPKLGAPLDIVVVFRFDPNKALPAGPFTQTSLPVYTTPQEMLPEAIPADGASQIAAKGTYVQVGYTVEFRPFIPQEALSFNPSSPPASIPGFLPGTVYTAKVQTTPGLKISNLTGPGGLVKFSTTIMPGGYFSNVGDDNPPELVSSVPSDGDDNFFPGLFSNTPVGSSSPTFAEPVGPSTISLVFDHGVNPSDENLLGRDWNDDGLLDSTFFLRSRATKLIVAHTVPAGALSGAPAFSAISGLDESAAQPQLVVDPQGGDVFLHNSSGGFTGPGATTALVSTPTCLASCADPSLTFAVFAGAGNDSLSVIDHMLGDPRFAKLASSAKTIPLDDAVGLVSLLDGRLVAFDRTTRRIVELQPVVTRDVPVGAPTLVSVTSPLDPGQPAGFLSAAFPALDVRDLAQAPSGALYALTVSGNNSSLVRLHPIDFNVDGTFSETDGTPDGSAPIPLPSSGPYDAIEFLSETSVLALQRKADAVDRLDLANGAAQRVVSNLAGFGTLSPGENSPALSILVGHIDLDVTVDLVDNQPDRAEIVLDPISVLAPSTSFDTVSFDVMQRPNLATLAGVTDANFDLSQPGYVLGSRRLLSVGIAAPQQTLDDCGAADPEGRVHDVMVEQFEDQDLEDPTALSTNPLADWGGPVPGALTSGRLSASVGVSGTAELGDFRPQPFPDFNEDLGYAIDAGSVDNAGWHIIYLDTDAQNFPLGDGSTPGVVTPVTVYGGKFGFHDVIIPKGVWLVARGSNPLQITATGRVEIAGLIDISGADGIDDVTFDTGFLPVPGGLGGPGGGRGGDGQPTLWNPKYAPFIQVGTGQLAAQYVTPEHAGDGLGPVIGPTGSLSLGPVGGKGGASTIGYNANPGGYPTISNAGHNNEYSRPPGGGGGSFYFHGMAAHNGTGSFRVQSDSQWPPFTLCPQNTFIHDGIYGNEELQLQGFTLPKLQCVYLQGTLSNPDRFQPGGLPGLERFIDGNPANDYIGPGGELPILIGGQGGGGGGTRIDSYNAAVWSANRTAAPVSPFPPYYPALAFGNIFWSPSLYDAKGGGGGGGGGSILIRSYGDIRLTPFGHINASGGNGLGGETIGASNYSGGGGGGSGGAILLQAAGEIQIEADPGHVTPGYVDASLKHGAALDVSGGFGCDAIESPEDQSGASPPKFEGTFSRSDGGQGGFGLIQLQTGGSSGAPQIEQGAFLFARQKLTLKVGGWNNTAGLYPLSAQKEHYSWGPTALVPPPSLNTLRYIDVLEYRMFRYETAEVHGEDGAPLNWFVINGSDPPVIEPDTVVPPSGYQLDSTLIEHYGRRVVREPQPGQLMRSYSGFDPVTFKEANWCGSCVPKKYLNTPPGLLYAPTDDIPLSIYLKEPDGTPLKQDPDATDPFAEFARDNTIDRLPVVPFNKMPPPIGSVSRGTSTWLDFNGVVLRARDSAGLAPPLFPGINGTYNALLGSLPPGTEGQVVLGQPVGNVPGDTPAHFVAKTGLIPGFDPGLCPNLGAASPPFNDIKVDSPDYGIDNAITDNAKVTLEFQGAFAIRAGSHVPDPDTVTVWVSDLRALSGFPLVRFRVNFDLGINGAFPFGPDSKKPGVDSLRLRTEY